MFSRFPHSEPIILDKESYSVKEVMETLSPLISENRKKRIDETISQRTYTVTVVLDDLFDKGNVSAVLRSCEGMGFQSLHNIETRDKFKAANRVTQGADKWLDIFRWKTRQECISDLKAKGYRICATMLKENCKPIGEIDFTQPTALVLGAEHDGISKEIEAAADDCVIIPMQGFVQSYNISVAAAISLYHILSDRIRRQGFHGDLSESEKTILRAIYYIRSFENSREVLRNLK